MTTHPAGHGGKAPDGSQRGPAQNECDTAVCPDCGATKCCYECATRGGPGASLLEAIADLMEQIEERS